MGAADKAANLGGESPLPSIARFRRVAYPECGKRLTARCPDVKVTAALRCRTAVVGATRVASKPGGLNIRECLQPRNRESALKSLCGIWLGKPTYFKLREGRCSRGRNEREHLGTRRGRGPDIQGRICRDKVGKDRCPAGDDSNRQRPEGRA